MERTIFEKEGKSFEKHVRVEHYIWNYLYYLVYMENKNKFEYNGTESYIEEKIIDEDISWFPIQKAICLSKNVKEKKAEEDLAALMTKKFISFEKKIVTALKRSAVSQPRPNTLGEVSSKKASKAQGSALSKGK